MAVLPDCVTKQHFQSTALNLGKTVENPNLLLLYQLYQQRSLLKHPALSLCVSA